MSKRQPGQPKPVQQALTEYQPGAHLWAPFYVHWKGGVVSLLPVLVVFFITQPFSQAMLALTTWGYAIGPVVIIGTATVWALMSKATMHAVRYRDSLVTHLVAYGIVGAVVLTGLAVFSTGIGPALWTLLIEDVQFVRSDDAATAVILTAPLVGAAGAILGRWVMDREVTWHRRVVREPLPDVFDFVDRKHDKDDFKRM